MVLYALFFFALTKLFTISYRLFTIWGRIQSACCLEDIIGEYSFVAATKFLVWHDDTIPSSLRGTRLQNVPTRCREICFPKYWTNEFNSLFFSSIWCASISPFQSFSFHVGTHGSRIWQFTTKRVWLMILLSVERFWNTLLGLFGFTTLTHFKRDGSSWLRLIRIKWLCMLYL